MYSPLQRLASPRSRIATGAICTMTGAEMYTTNRSTAGDVNRSCKMYMRTIIYSQDHYLFARARRKFDTFELTCRPGVSFVMTSTVLVYMLEYIVSGPD